jgi:catechol-2,3-dioxygenase
VYTYYAIGNIYHHIGIDEKDRDILRKAEEYYLKALEIDPKHEQSENELATLRKDMKNM